MGYRYKPTLIRSIRRRMKANKLKAGGYCRVSTKGQVDKISLADQKKQIEDYCKNRNLNLIQTYIEKGVSGRTCDRPEFRKMLSDAANKEFQILVVADNDRFGRNAIDRLRIRETLTKDFGIALHSVKDGVYKDDATGKFQDNIKASVSEYFRDLQVEKSASALSFKLSTRGERNIGHLLYGLTWADDKSAAIHHTVEYPDVRLIVELRLRQKWSYATIAGYLNGQFTNRKGASLAKKCKVKLPILYRRNKPWDRQKVSYICSLNAKKYCSGKSSVTFQGETFTYDFPPLISKLELLQLKGITPDYINGQPRKQYLLSNKLVCSLCGSKLHHNIIRNKYKGRKREYQYYVCRNKLESSNGERCQLPSIPQEWIEWWVWQQLTGLFQDQEHFEQVVMSSNAETVGDRIRIGQIYKKLESLRQIQISLTGQINRLLDTVSQGGYNDEYVKSVRGRVLHIHSVKAKAKKERKELEQELSLIEQRIDYLSKLPETRLWWLEYSDKLKDEDKRKLVDALIERIEISPRTYTKAQAERDDKHGGGPDTGLEAKISIEVFGRIPFYRSYKDGEYQPFITHNNMGGLKFIITR